MSSGYSTVVARSRQLAANCDYLTFFNLPRPATAATATATNTTSSPTTATA